MIKRNMWLVLGVIGLATAVALLPPSSGQQALAFLLLWIVPIPFLVSILHGQLKPQPPLQGRPSPTVKSENWLIAAGLTLLIHPLLALLIHYLPGPIPNWTLLLIVTLVALIPLLTSRLSPLASHLSSPVLLILLLALLLRLPNMGYKEIQGDEGVILVRAAAALTGDDAELFLHQKGPMEILLPLVTWGVTGTLTDFWARLPFLWAGWLGVGAVILLARRWFNGRIALIAGLLFAIMGFSIAFSRIVQYQTLVLLWGLLALLTATRYRDEGRPLDLYVTAVFLAGGLLAHYDMVLVVPAVGWILASGGGRVREWGIAGLLGVGVLGLFYVPFALNPNFGRTVTYLLNDRVGTAGGVTGWSGTAVWQMMTFYNSAYYIVGVMGLLLVGLWVLWRRREGGGGRPHLPGASYFLHFCRYGSAHTCVYDFSGRDHFGRSGSSHSGRLVAHEFMALSRWPGCGLGLVCRFGQLCLSAVCGCDTGEAADLGRESAVFLPNHLGRAAVVWLIWLSAPGRLAYGSHAAGG